MKKVFSIFLFLFIGVFLVEASVIDSNFVVAKVKAVHDGDSYKVEYWNPDSTYKHTIWIRLAGVDCPEVKSDVIKEPQPYGVMIGDTLRKMLKDSTIFVKFIGTDWLYRPLVVVKLNNGQDLASLLLSNGWAWYYSTTLLNKETRNAYQKMRDKAKKAKKGLWFELNPTNPKDHRKKYYGVAK